MNNRCKSSIIYKVIQIEGWFDELELGLLIDCVERVTLRNRHYSGQLNIVEIGSYRGKSTIAMGLTLIASHRNSTIYAVDPHEGLRSGKYDRIHHEAPTYDCFLRNVRYYGLENVIKCVKCKSTETSLEVPVSLILIDRLHLFENVREDFLHFEKNLSIGSLALFHDFSDEFPGVLRFVITLHSTRKTSPYIKVDKCHSLIVLEKVS